MSEKSFLVAGLGNIGAEYASTRHNIGFMILDAWGQASNVLFHTDRYGDLATISVKGREFHLLKPSTYMNLSGNAVRYWMQKLDLAPDHVMVVCDDLNLPFGSVRMRKSGSDGGHNGLKNIREMLGTQDFPRCRVGVGHDFAYGGQIDFVLGEFSSEQKAQIPELASKVIEGVRTWGLAGIEKAMNQINSRQKTAKSPEEPV